MIIYKLSAQLRNQLLFKAVNTLHSQHITNSPYHSTLLLSYGLFDSLSALFICQLHRQIADQFFISHRQSVLEIALVDKLPVFIQQSTPPFPTVVAVMTFICNA